MLTFRALHRRVIVSWFTADCSNLKMKKNTVIGKGVCVIKAIVSVV